MEKKRISWWWLALIVAVLAAAVVITVIAINKRQPDSTADSAPDYSASENWAYYSIGAGKSADLFLHLSLIPNPPYFSFSVPN
mgnify:CR=1 FL=1